MSREYIAATLKRLREKKGMTADQVGEIIGKSGKTVNAWENGRGQPDAEILIKLCGIYDVENLLAEFDTKNIIKSNTRLLSGEKEIIKKYRALDWHGREVVDTILDIEYNRVADNEKSAVKRYTIRLADIGASAGTGNPIDDSQFEDIEVEDTPEARVADFAVRVDGNSMLPDYEDGDIVFVSQQPSVYIGQVGIFCVDGNTYIKELGNGELISTNPQFENIPLNEYSYVSCAGRVIGKANVL